MAATQTAQLVDGTDLAKRIIQEAAAKAAEISRSGGTSPCLATVRVGEDPASVTFVRMKRARCAKAGIQSRHIALPATTTTAELIDTLAGLSSDPEVHGILLQHPCGPHVDERAAFEAIAPGRMSTGSRCIPSPR